MQTIKKTVFTFLALVVVWVGYINVLLAQQPVEPIPGEGADLVGWIVTMLQWLIALSGIVAAAILIFNGFMYITASGDEGKIQKATKGITYAIVGLIIAAVAFLIVNFVVQQIEDSRGGYDFDREIELVA